MLNIFVLNVLKKMIVQLSFMYFFIASPQVYILPGMSLLKKKEEKKKSTIINLTEENTKWI